LVLALRMSRDWSLLFPRIYYQQTALMAVRVNHGPLLDWWGLSSEPTPIPPGKWADSPRNSDSKRTVWLRLTEHGFGRLYTPFDTLRSGIR